MYTTQLQFLDSSNYDHNFTITYFYSYIFSLYSLENYYCVINTYVNHVKI